MNLQIGWSFDLEVRGGFAYLALLGAHTPTPDHPYEWLLELGSSF